MKPFYEPLDEWQRIGRGKPGRVPKGKPRVTDGTIAGIRRETPKQVIQQLPTGKAVCKANPELEAQIDAIISDVILANANAGGTPYSKSKRAIKDTIDSGASAAYCFYNRRGDNFFADFRRVFIKDIMFEKGKVSEFDSNTMYMDVWLTKMDIKALIHQHSELEKRSKERKEKYEGEWDLKALAQLLETGEQEKDGDQKTEQEKSSGEGTVGYYKLTFCFQIGIGAKFYAYSDKLQKHVYKCVNKDPRGLMPIHILVPEEDDSNPLGEALLAISAGKQNLVDFDMQMYQYSQGLQYSPPVTKRGNVPTSAIKLVPDAVIDLGTNMNNQIEVMQIGNKAQDNFSNNYGLLKSQILNEMGRTGDTSISGDVGNPGFSKTPAGINALQQRLSISDNDLRKSYEQWFGRVLETCVNIHLAESQGVKDVELQKSTLKKLDMRPEDTMQFDYDQDLGAVQFTIDASSSKKQDEAQQTEILTGLLEVTSKFGTYPIDKQMQIQNRIIESSGVDDPEKLTFTDEEIEEAKMQAEAEKQMALQQQEQMAAQAPNGEMVEEPVLELGMEPVAEEMPVEVPQEDLNEDDLQVIEALQERGYSDDQIATAVIMLKQDYSDEEIIQVLKQPEEVA